MSCIHAPKDISVRYASCLLNKSRLVGQPEVAPKRASRRSLRQHSPDAWPVFGRCPRSGLRDNVAGVGFPAALMLDGGCGLLSGFTGNPGFANRCAKPPNKAWAASRNPNPSAWHFVGAALVTEIGLLDKVPRNPNTGPVSELRCLRTL